MIRVALNLGLCLFATLAAAQPSPLIEGKEYSINAGGGEGKIRFEKGRYHISLPILFAGGILFGNISAEEASKRTRFPAPPPQEFYKPGAKSIEDIPPLKAKILELVKGIESVYDSPYLTPKIAPKFLKDETVVLDKETLESGLDGFDGIDDALNEGLPNRRSKELKIIVTPTPNPDFISPALWDPMFARHELLAHEIGHNLGIMEEGFTLKNYPLNGLMTDETGLKVLELKSCPAKMKIYETDFHSMMQTLLQTARPQIDLAKLKQYFPTTIVQTYQDARVGDSGANWYGLSREERVEILNRELPEQIKNNKIECK
ncbi:MAG: hypothetical protein AB7O96_14390 [Pseudobdellovibrionaceae bacterium]